MSDKDNTNDKPKTSGTLSLGGTLSVGGGQSRPKSGIAVEVRRRRFNTPVEGSDAATQIDTSEDSELARRAQALEEAKKNAAEEEKRREEERKQAEQLSQMKADQAEEAKRREEEEAKRLEAGRLAKEEAERIAKEEAALEAVRQEKAQKERETKREDTRKSSGKPKQSEKRAGRAAYTGGLGQRFRTIPNSKRRGKKNAGPVVQEEREKVIRDVEIPENITVQELAARMSEKVGEVVKKLMMMGQMVTQNQSIDQDTAVIIVEEFGHRYTTVSDDALEEEVTTFEDDAKSLKGRPPVVTVMGHVDHGKTTLLDALRTTDVVGGEAGGITQHIGAYQVKTKAGKHVTFLDTPGHEAFTAMRARGASVTDVVILVVSADDSIMPQTIEAINHAKSAEVPIIVAINKIDKPDANVDRVKQDLLSHDLIPEDFGGDIVCVPISAKQRTNLDELIEMVLLQADMLDLKANPSRRANGIVIESRLDKGRGPVATVIVEGGTLKKGDIFVMGTVQGRVRMMLDDKGNAVKEAEPARPVELVGLQAAAEAGDEFVVVENERKAREIIDFREEKRREAIAAAGPSATDLLFGRIKEGEDTILNVVLKGDVQGSVEAIKDALNKLETADSKVKVVHSGVGIITETDITLAQTAGAAVVGFNVRANPQARTLAEREKIDIRYYNVIYNLIDDIKAAMAGLLSPDEMENVIGQAEVRQIFKAGKTKIAGCMVTSGVMRRDGKVRLIRDGKVILDGQIDGLKRFKDDAKEVAENYECGITLAKFDDVHEGDIIEAYEIVEIEKSVADLERAAKDKREKDELDELEKATSPDA